MSAACEELPAQRAFLPPHPLLPSPSPSHVLARSRNCCLELSAAILSRGVHQRTWVYVTDEVADSWAAADAVVDELKRAGIRVFWNADALLRDLSEIAYRVSGSDVTRCVQWFREFSSALPHVARHNRLSAPVRKRADFPLGPRISFLPWWQPSTESVVASSDNFDDFEADDKRPGGGPPSPPYGRCRCRLPEDAVYAGSLYLSADGLVLGSVAALTVQQLTVVIFTLAFVANVVCVTLSIERDGDLLFAGFTTFIDSVFFITIIAFVGLAAPAVLVVALPLLGNLDARSRHSELLVPLHVAAYMNAAARLPATLRRRSFREGLGLPGSPSERLSENLPDSTSTSGSASLKVCFLLSRAPHRLPEVAGPPFDARLEDRLINVCRFLRAIGLDAVVVPPRAEDGTCDDRHREVRGSADAPNVISVCVYVLRSEEAALAWCATQYSSASCSDDASQAIPYTRQLLVVDGPANANLVYPAVPEPGRGDAPPRSQVWLRDTVYSE